LKNSNNTQIFLHYTV